MTFWRESTETTPPLKQSLTNHWFSFLLGLSVAIHVVTIGRALTGAPYIHGDGAFYQHAGWYITEGATPYIDIWDVKPPLVFEWPAALALLAGGNMFLLHLLHVATTSLAAIGTTALIGLITYRLTTDELAALTAGLFPMTFTTYQYVAAHGFRPKHFTLFCGLAALYLHFYSRRTVLSGALATLATGFWHFGLIFPLLLFTDAVRNPDKDLKKTLAGFTIATLIIITPLLWMGALKPALIISATSPFISEEQWQLLFRLWKGSWMLGYLIPLVPIAAYGAATLRTHRDRWWVVTGLTWFVIQLLRFDLDGTPDLLAAISFTGICLGFAVSELNRTQREAVMAYLGVLLVLSTVFLGGFQIIGMQFQIGNEFGADTYGDINEGGVTAFSKWTTDLAKTYVGYSVSSSTSAETSTDVPLPSFDHRAMYWGQHRPCHYYIGDMGKQWIRQTNGQFIDTDCYKALP